MVLGRTFDEEALPELNTEALDFKAASECFSRFRKLTPASLRSLHLTTTHQRREVPTVGGVLLFGVDRLKCFPDAFIRAGCFAGVDKSRILDSAMITDYPVRAVEQAVAVTGRPAVVYPNSGEGWDAGARGWTGRGTFDPGRVRAWTRAGARLVGGCCRVGPDLITELGGRLESQGPP